jgi:hypothetical protein
MTGTDNASNGNASNGNASNGGDENTDENAPSSCQDAMFESMTHSGKRFLFLFALPVLWIVFIAVGWSKEDRIETEVNAIWTRQRSSYKADLDYAEQLNADELGQSTSFAAMAISRDGANLFTPDRLEEIRLRMEETENTTVRSSLVPIHPPSFLFCSDASVFGLHIGRIQWQHIQLGRCLFFE